MDAARRWYNKQKKSRRHQNESMESNENDITKADLKKVIREELEAFLDEYYNN